jgi:hypothetical protein
MTIVMMPGDRRTRRHRRFVTAGPLKRSDPPFKAENHASGNGVIAERLFKANLIEGSDKATVIPRRWRKTAAWTATRAIDLCHCS